ncbi:MAG: hypothetical protein Q8N40_08435 [Bradyrhizobium sp.]|nr:hypothetical protein [Bradyrhizobium sp.]
MGTISVWKLSAILVGVAAAVALPGLECAAAAPTAGETHRSPVPAGAMRLAQADTAREVITLPNKPPQRSGESNPSSQALIETWLGGYGWNKDKRFDLERYEIVNRRVVWAGFGRALLQFRVLPVDGDAMALAAKRCPGRKRPIEMQIYFQWGPHNKLWTALANRGDPGFEPCSNDELWTGEQLELIVNPPPLPAPPKIAQKDVATPPSGSPERKAILDGLRPTFEKAFGKPVEFKVETLRAAAGFAWVVVHPQRPNGVPIGRAEWDEAVGPCEQNRTTAVAQFWMRQRHDGWRVGWGNGFCASDSIAELGYLIGAPPQLVDLREWPGTDFMPVDDPQYFDLWKP